MKDSSIRTPGSPRDAPVEEPPSQLKVTAVVVFYLIAAIVVSLSSGVIQHDDAPSTPFCAMDEWRDWEGRRERYEG